MISPEFKEEVLSKWHNLDENRRKQAIFLAALMVALILATQPLSCHFSRSRSSAVAASSLPANPSSAPSPANTSPAASVAVGDFTGHWRGTAPVGRQGHCTLSLEIRQLQQGRFSSYPQIACAPVGSVWRTGNPSSAIMSGAAAQSAIEFHVDTVTSTNEMGCSLGSPLTVRSFGSNQLAVKWEDACGGGSMLLARQMR